MNTKQWLRILRLIKDIQEKMGVSINTLLERMEKRQGLFKFTPWIERGWREDKDYSGLLLVHREDGERTRIGEVYFLYIEKLRKIKDYSSLLLE